MRAARRSAHCGGTRSSASPWKIVVGTAMSSGANPHGRIHARYSSTIACVDRHASAAAVASAGSLQCAFFNHSFGVCFAIAAIVAKIFFATHARFSHMRVNR
jgi:hypothetical protein